MSRIFGTILLIAAAACAHAERFDIVVYGATSGGVAAAVQASRMGKRVALIHTGPHLGGLTSGGLGSTDTGNRKAIGGIASEFYRRIKDYYGAASAWKQEKRTDFLSGPDRTKWRKDWTELIQEPEWYFFEPHAAEEIYNRMASEAKVAVYRSERLDLKRGVRKSGTRITSIVMESGKQFEAAVFLDCSYEGDLMAKAGVSYAYGREAQSEYGELFAGYRPIFTRGGHQFLFDLDPYIKRGDRMSGLLPGIRPLPKAREGDSDKNIQAYNFRLVMTDVPANRVPFSKPEHYDPRHYELLLRYMQASEKAGDPLWIFGDITHLMPNRKSDSNNHGAFSTDDIGMNYDYPEGDYATRKRVYQEHVDYTKGMIWFVLTDPRVPEHAKKEVSRWGWPKDEFQDNGHFPHELYVREARRMIGEYVMTEHDCSSERSAPESAALGSYAIDSHVTQRYVDKHGHVRNEGTLGGAVPRPYPVSYRSMTPKRTECTNLLVPVCLSSTHSAYGSIRMEPVFMALGQSAATAASMAIDAKSAVQDVPYAAFRKKLLQDKQVLDWDEPPRTGKGVKVKDLPGVVVRLLDAHGDGYWTYTGALPSALFVGQGYVDDQNANKGEKSMRYQAQLTDGEYEVRMSYSSGADRAAHVPVTIRHAAGQTERFIDETRQPADLFVSLGTFRFSRQAPAVVTVGTAGTKGHVTADAVQFLPARATAAAATEIKNIEYSSPNGRSLKLDAYLPARPKPYPALIWVHGGGFSKGAKDVSRPTLLTWTAEGYAVFAIEYRLAPEFHFPAPVDDVGASVRWLKAHAPEYGVDPNRIALIGSSAGAQLVAYVGAVSGKELGLRGVVSFSATHELMERAKRDGSISPGICALLSVTPEVTSEKLPLLRKASPYYHVKPDMPPLLLMHGTEDKTVPNQQSRDMYQHVKDIGGDVELFLANGGGHGFPGWDKLSEAASYRSVLFRWLDQRLRNDLPARIGLNVTPSKKLMAGLLALCIVGCY